MEMMLFLQLFMLQGATIGALGIIGDAFSKLFEIIWDFGKWILEGIGNIFKTLFEIVTGLFKNLFDILIGFFEMIIAVIEGFLYLLYMLGVLAAKFFLVLFETAKILWSLVVGFGRTLASLSYSPRASAGHGYSETIGKLFSALKPLQIEPIAYILLFILWYVTAISAMKLISSIRVGGD